jgi:histidyl-tRNA synthetase
MFRYERMKTGRYRQFFQLGAEAYGAKESAQDIEVIDLAVHYLSRVGVPGVSLHLNSLGDDACRPQFQASLVAYLAAHRASLCADCQVRLEKNPMRVLDCKNEGCQKVSAGAPSILESLCAPCAEHFAQVRQGLEALGIGYQVNPKLVRGLDYYTRTAFELIASDPVLGTAGTVGGGGRYDKLVRALGGPDVPAVGFALGLDRLAILLGASARKFGGRPKVFLASVDDAAHGEILRLVSQLRHQGIWAEFDPRGGSLKSQMKRADKSGAAFALVLGESELASRTAELKPMAGGTPRRVSLDALPQALAEAATT